MTTEGPPPERHSLYPEPRYAGGVPAEPTPPSRSRFPLTATLIAVGVLLALAGAAIAAIGMVKDRASAAVEITDPEGQVINAIQVEAGMCLAGLPDNGDVATVTALPCTEPHRAQAVVVYAATTPEWPGREQLLEDAIAFCGAFIQPGFEDDAMFRTSDWQDGLRWVAWIPTKDAWSAGNRDALCIVHREGDIVGSFTDNSATFIN